MKNPKIFILFALLLVPTLVFSQKWKLSRSEYIYGIGINNLFGDIGGATSSDASRFADLDLASSRPILTLGYRYKFYERIAAKANFSYAYIHASDVNSVNEDRNYAVSSNLFEFYAQAEYHLLKEKQMVTYNSMSMRGKLQKFNAGINLYVFMGVGGAYFIPKAKDDFSGSSRFVDNKNFTFVFPIGFGIKYPLTSITDIGFELGGRFTTTDFIDGFKPEKSVSNDMYYFTVINVSTKIKKIKRRTEMRF